MRISDIFPFLEKEIRFRHFLDNLNNFEIIYPEGWKFDEDIAVIDGKYTIEFRSGNSYFTVYVDAKLPAKLDFAEYVRKESGPESGICGEMEKTTFHGMPAYKREYCLQSGGTREFGAGIIFHSSNKIFSLSWMAPEKDREKMEDVFEKMRKSFKVRQGFSIVERSR